MTVTTASVHQLCSVLRELREFVQTRGVEFRYEIGGDLNLVKPPLTGDDLKEFTRIDGSVIQALGVCSIEAFHDLHQPLEGAYDFGRTKVRCVDGPQGPSIVYSQKWLVYIGSLEEEAAALLNSSATRAPSICKLAVELSTSCDDNNYLSLSGNPKGKVSFETAVFLQGLIDAGREQWRSAREIEKASQLPDDVEIRVTRIKEALRKSAPDVEALIESSGARGSRLKLAAWHD